MQHAHARRAASPRGRCNVVAWTWVLAVLAITAWTNPALGAGFLAIQGIEGESVNERHKGEIEILAHELSFALPPSAMTGGRVTGRLGCTPMSVWKNIDASSVVLAKKLLDGRFLDRAVLTFQRDGIEQRDYYFITLRDVLITGFDQNGSADSNRVVEKVVFLPRRYDFEYRWQLPDGSPGGPIKMSWDCVTGEVT